MIIKFPESKITDEIYDVVTQRYTDVIVSYIIDSKYRKSVYLKNWLKEQLDDPSEKVLSLVNDVDTEYSHDEQMITILRYVRAHFKYVSDNTVWKMTEKWQTAEESVDKMTGDCEDGAILMYIIARLKGVPSNRLLICAGDVVGGGHCWLAYKPDGIPKDYVFLDWCYWVNVNGIDSRNYFSIIGQDIDEYHYNDLIIPLNKSNYISTWFTFNELYSYRLMNYKW